MLCGVTDAGLCKKCNNLRSVEISDSSRQLLAYKNAQGVNFPEMVKSAEIPQNIALELEVERRPDMPLINGSNCRTRNPQ